MYCSPSDSMSSPSGGSKISPLSSSGSERPFDTDPCVALSICSRSCYSQVNHESLVDPRIPCELKASSPCYFRYPCLSCGRHSTNDIDILWCTLTYRQRRGLHLLCEVVVFCYQYLLVTDPSTVTGNAIIRPPELLGYSACTSTLDKGNPRGFDISGRHFDIGESLQVRWILQIPRP